MRIQRLLVPVVVMMVLGAAASVSAQAPPMYGPPITLEQAKKVMAGAEAEARKSAASIGTLRIMGLLLSSASTGAPGRLDSEVNGGDPIFERWTSLHIVITRGGTPLDCFFWLSRQVQVPVGGAPHVRVARHAQSLYAPGLRPAAKAPRPGARRGADAAGRLQRLPEGGRG